MKTTYKNIGRFLEQVDRRTKKYRELEKNLIELEKKYGKDSKEVNEFFLSNL